MFSIDLKTAPTPNAHSVRAQTSHHSRHERGQIACRKSFGEVNPRTACSSAPPRAFLLGWAQAWTAPCSLHSEEGERGKGLRVREMNPCSRAAGEMFVL